MDANEEKIPPVAPASHFWKELLKLVFFSLIIVIPFRLYVAQPFIVDGLSMFPTFHNGNYLIIDELTYHFHTPERGSVLVFKYPKDPKKYFIKRVIGLPNETVSIKDGVVSIIQSGNSQGVVLDEPYVKMPKADTLTYTLLADEYFVMGDNRLQSADSRLWGPVPKANIVGRPFLRFLPPSFFPGTHTLYTASTTNLTL
jgi:signal peptidase I